MTEGKAMTRLALSIGLIVATLASLAAQGNSRKKDRPPTVSITAVGSPFTTERTVTITASASDDHGIRQVEFFDGGASKGIDTTAPYSVDWSIAAANNGVHNWWATATDTAGQRRDSATIYLTVNIQSAPPPPPPPTPPSAVQCGTPTGTAACGPQPNILCPANAINVWPGTDIRGVVSAAAGWTTFCLRAGVHQVRDAITPKTGDVLIGEYGAILDGTGWVTSDRTMAAIRAHNQDIDDVTIKNIVCANMPQRCVHAYQWMSDRWTIENNEFAKCFTGAELPNGAAFRNNLVHDCIGNPYADLPADRGGALSGNKPTTVLIEGNEFYRNGPEQKLVEGRFHTWRRNYFHDTFVGVWEDGDNSDVVIDATTCSDVTWQCVFPEISQRITVTNTTVIRGETGVFVSTSKDVDVSGTTCTDVWRCVTLFVNCDAVGTGAIGADLANVNVHDSVVNVGLRPGSFANSLTYADACSATQIAPYLTGAKNLTFARNAYDVPDPSTSWWLFGQTMQTFAQWQAHNFDLAGSVR